MSPNTTSYDIAIVGGGMVGMAVALMLAQHTSLRIVILEAKSPPKPLDLTTHHHRVSSFSLSSVRLFKHLGIWPHIINKRVSSFHGITVWDKSNQHLTFDSNDIAEKTLGYIIENNIVEHALYEELKQHEHITWIHHARLKNMTETTHHISLETDDAHIIHAHLAIAADGAQSALRDAAGIATTQHDYKQSALVAMVETEKPHEHRARQIFLASGTLAFLPLDHPHHCSIVWSLQDDAAQLKLPSDDQFNEALQHAFGDCLGTLNVVSERFSFPLSQQNAAQYVKSRVVLVSDAAHTIHPLAGQGVNIGLLDAASLLDVMLKGLKNLPVDRLYLVCDQYERWRKAENFVLLQSVHWLNSFMMNETKSISYIKKIGLKNVNRMSWLKKMIMHYAVGNRLGLPTLAK